MCVFVCSQGRPCVADWLVCLVLEGEHARHSDRRVCCGASWWFKAPPLFLYHMSFLSPFSHFSCSLSLYCQKTHRLKINVKNVRLVLCRVHKPLLIKRDQPTCAFKSSPRSLHFHLCHYPEPTVCFHTHLLQLLYFMQSAG